MAEGRALATGEDGSHRVGKGRDDGANEVDTAVEAAKRAGFNASIDSAWLEAEREELFPRDDADADRGQRPKRRCHAVARGADVAYRR